MKIKSKKEDKMTKITIGKLNAFIDDLSFTYCTECARDADYDCNNCIVWKVYDLLCEHLKEECKEQLKRRPNDLSCEGCTYKCN